MQPTPTHDERWLPVPGYEGRYEVSDHGRVRSLDTQSVNQFGATSTQPGKIRALWTDRRGYQHVTLYRDNAQKRHSVHVLMMLAFVGPRPEGMNVCHNNGNPSDNRLPNLRYDTQSSNQLDRVEHDTHVRGLRNPRNRHSENDIRTIRSLYATGKYSQREIGEMYGVRQAAISGVVLRRSWAWLD